MMHRNRRFCVSAVPSAEEMAHMLVARTWTLCSGFYISGHEGYLFLNDSIHEDGAGEWGVIRCSLGAGAHVQVESITFSWCDFPRALAYVQDAIAGRMDANDFARPVSLRLETPEKHKRCHLCA